MVLFAARHVNTCVSYTCKCLNPFVFHRENNIILDWNDVGVSKPWSLYSLVIIVLIIPRFGWKTWAIWVWPSVRSSGRYSRTDRLLALLWCCAVQFRFQAVDVWNALGPFRRPRRFSQSCEVQLPDVSDHRARRQKAAAVPLEPSATGYLLESGRFHVRHEETHRSTRLLLMSESLNSCIF